ncbi:hypothetical protein PQR67_12040 [Paraburkholderia fungorum]|uniref:hypothetical protein n=1 Tax=Paraburkholderia fungorum TaxID=134537 RepID=UPI0038BD73EB
MAIDVFGSPVCATAGVETDPDKTALDVSKAANVLNTPLWGFAIEGLVMLGCP